MRCVAIDHLNRAIELDPKNARQYFARAWSKQHVGDLEGAIADYKRDVVLDATDAKGYNNLAWLLATTEPVSLRNGPQAVEFGLRACELSRWKNSTFVGTLAAAYARNGDYVTAIEMHLKAVDLAGYANYARSPSADKMLELYRSGRPWPPD